MWLFYYKDIKCWHQDDISIFKIILQWITVCEGGEVLVCKLIFGILNKSGGIGL